MDDLILNAMRLYFILGLLVGIVSSGIGLRRGFNYSWGGRYKMAAINIAVVAFIWPLVLKPLAKELSSHAKPDDKD